MSAPSPHGPVALVLERLQGVRRSKHGWIASCPAHEDRNPSLSIGLGPDGRVLLHCHAGCSLDAIVGACRLHASDLFPETPRQSCAARPRPQQLVFTAADAKGTWEMAFDRAQDDEFAEADREVYEYLDGRGLGEAWELRLFGVIGTGMRLPHAVDHWLHTGHRVVAPLHDEVGEVAGVQSRTILRTEPKTLFPAGSTVKGLAFADRRGLDLLRGAACDVGAVVLGEGLTDFLAIAIASPFPVLAAPGTGFVPAAIGHWAARRIVYIATDNDDAGEKVVHDAASRAYACGCMSARRVHWPGGAKDACDLVNARGMGALHDFLNSLAGEARP